MENGLVLNGRGSGVWSFRGNPGGGEEELEEKNRARSCGNLCIMGSIDHKRSSLRDGVA